MHGCLVFLPIPILGDCSITIQIPIPNTRNGYTIIPIPISNTRYVTDYLKILPWISKRFVTYYFISIFDHYEHYVWSKMAKQIANILFIQNTTIQLVYLVVTNVEGQSICVQSLTQNVLLGLFLYPSEGLTYPRRFAISIIFYNPIYQWIFSITCRLILST